MLLKKEAALAPFKSHEIDEILQLFNEKTNKYVGKGISISSPQYKGINTRLEKAIEQVENIFNYVSVHNKLPIAEIRETILPTIQEATEIPHLYHLFFQLQSTDDYTYSHNIGVGVIATMIGKWLKMGKEDLLQLTLAATLHDIGKTKIPLDILNKPGKLTEKEYEIVKKHTIFGYQLLNESPGLSSDISIVALQHHEREDGGGYPLRLKGNRTNYMSKIVAVADVFHAMSSNRSYHTALPFFQVIKQMNSDVFGKFDPKIMLTFLKNIMDSLVGYKVKLTDGRIAAIVMINQYDVVRPLVKIDDEIIDLSKSENLNIVSVVS